MGCIRGIRGAQPCGLPVASAILRGQNHGTYGSQPCGLWVLSVGVAIVGLGRYTYYIYVGDMNPLREIYRVVETRRGTSLRRV